MASKWPHRRWCDKFGSSTEVAYSERKDWTRCFLQDAHPHIWRMHCSSLDTLKRVVKAGDGTILATSPPYTRFLNSGVDFAIVTTGMPRIDIWVQEFLRHEIPCVSADYLVEYVCKPGYSLEKHVLYNTHKWAEKSLANLLTRSKEVLLDDSLTSAGDRSDDLICVVCGSLDRGEVMLICGDEGGTLGCGIGTHIDCCDPPLEAVPVDDWFCPSCSKTVEQKITVSSTKAKSKKRKHAHEQTAQREPHRLPANSKSVVCTPSNLPHLSNSEPRVSPEFHKTTRSRPTPRPDRTLPGTLAAETPVSPPLASDRNSCLP
ncbi:hypothetical protein HPP92_002052 [Vanilla planifolia]|uniref:PHD-type domain-containing protein n=1 Tax=Vanilla planifolia TaxID=51239 RepID=A0A835RS90_VANPL|nr:hypothetical protein HPP92_002052 [Vanilla planifolia]